MKHIILEVTETTTRRIVLRARSEKTARAMIEAGPLSYLKAEVSNEIVEYKITEVKTVVESDGAQ